MQGKWSVEITLDGEKIFGLYSDGNMLISSDPDLRSVAREQLTASLTALQED
jgi:hypothetical protein